MVQSSSLIVDFLDESDWNPGFRHGVYQTKLTIVSCVAFLLLLCVFFTNRIGIKASAVTTEKGTQLHQKLASFHLTPTILPLECNSMLNSRNSFI